MEKTTSPVRWLCLGAILATWYCNLAAGYVLHLSETLQRGEIVFDASLANGTVPWKYSVEKSQSSGQGRHLLRVDAASGLVSLRKPFDCSRLHGNPFTVYIEAVSDFAAGKGDLNYTLTPLTVTVHGRKCFPEFSKHERRKVRRPPIVVGVHDGTFCFSPRQSLLSLDDFLPRSLLYECAGGDAAVVYAAAMQPDWFQVEPLSGQIVSLTKRCLQQYVHLKLHLFATDSCDLLGKQTTLDLYLGPTTAANGGGGNEASIENGRRRLPRSIVKRAANRAPQFSQNSYQASVPENQNAGYTISIPKATDSDSGAAGDIVYSMTASRNGDSQALFEIDSKGVVRTTEVLDREGMPAHYFTVIATDRGSPAMTGQMDLTIVVLDTNDHGPVFESSDGTSVYEDISKGSTIIGVHASDRDIDENKEIVYSIVNLSGVNTAFAIDSDSGIISTRTALDRETTSLYTLEVMAVDQAKVASQRQTAVMTVAITVQDVNDNAPVFQQNSYRVEINENVKLNQVIASMLAEDGDQGTNADVRYSMVAGNSLGHFAVDTVSGQISIINRLDFEAEDNFRLKVRAQDGGNPPKWSSVDVDVAVLDVNDNEPRFPSSRYQLSLREDVPLSHLVIPLLAFDADSSLHSQLTYTLEEASPTLPFAIDPGSGKVTVAKQLDREDKALYELTVVATDNGSPPMSGTTQLTLVILDVNDNPPIFSESAYATTVDEDAKPGTSVLTVAAHDPDADGSTVFYQITNGNTRNRFSILSQPDGGLITISYPLDYKQENKFVLTVTASDGVLSSACQVTVTVRDANTYPPVFEQTPYTITISEGVDVGFTLVTVHATDQDVGENQRITYSIDSVPEFTIDPDSGVITTKSKLDREHQITYTLQVTAQDNGLQPLHDTTHVEITVLDVNDNYPVFQKQSYQAEILESINVGDKVTQISATDADEGDNARVLYTFSGGKDGGGKFVIDSTSGVIRTNDHLDREDVASYDLEAYALDQGSPQLRRWVAVRVDLVDVNDNMPQWPAPVLEVRIEENSPKGSLVDTLKAADPDVGVNAEVSYTIIAGDADQFDLDRKSGQLRTLVDLDYEQHHRYQLKVRAKSEPLFSDAVVEVLVQDVNDNLPVFQDFVVVFNSFAGHFPAGDIGEVPASDPDVSDQLRYTILSGNNAGLITIDQSTGGIRLSPQLESNRLLTADMNIMVSDGLNEVRAGLTLKVSMVTEEMLYSSVTVRLDDMTQEDFLATYYDQFVDKLAQIVGCEPKHIYLFNVQDDEVTAGSNPILNISFSASQASGSFYDPKFLMQTVYLHRADLSEISLVLPFDDNLCLVEPCAFYEQCSSLLAFGSTSGFIYSTLGRPIIYYRPVHPVNQFSCSCPPGFSGNFCTAEINLCYSSPCLNQGICQEKEGGFTCICPQGFAGANCDIDYGQGQCQSHDLYCRNGDQCKNFLLGGFECECDEAAGYGGQFCELTSRSFVPGTYVTFPALNQRLRLHITISFATQEPDGLLLYNGRYNQQHDFIALEVRNGALEFTYSTGQTTQRLAVALEGGVNDGEWHTATIDYYDMEATLSVDDCDSLVSVKYGEQLGGYSCAARVKLEDASYRFLDLTGPLMLGGLPILPEEFQVGQTGYRGCMGPVHLDGTLLDLATNTSDGGSLPGCPDRHDFCASDPCSNGGTCLNGFARFACVCPEGYGGSTCLEDKGAGFKFTGNGYAQFVTSQIPQVKLPWKVSLMFRTRQESATLTYLKVGTSDEIMIKLSNGYIRYEHDGSVKATIIGTKANDGEWHEIQAELANGKLALNLDYGKYTASSSTMDDSLAGQKVSKLLVGGHLDLLGRLSSGFKGCLQGVHVGALVSTAGLSKINVQAGCPTSDPCTSDPCPANSYCSDDWEAHSCVCDKGYYGDQCAPACDLNPCENGGVCEMDPAAALGYTCLCSELYYGQYCQERIDQPCPDGWWGYPMCGPCSCDTSLGLSNVCNKTTGDCYCQSYSYRPKGSEVCYPCNCYALGSNSFECEQQTGQCSCRYGVQGRTCNTCAESTFEVTSSGCVAVLDACVQVYVEGILWPRTDFETTASENCPTGTVGTATRHCHFEGGWDQPDISNCTSTSFVTLRDMLAELDSSQLDSSRAKVIAEELAVATADTNIYYPNDLQVAYQMTAAVLTHEAGQSGLNLTTTKDILFTKNMVESSSRLLGMENVDLWHESSRGGGGASVASLMALYEEYAATLARNMMDTYSEPVPIITPNMVLVLEEIPRLAYNGSVVPNYQSDAFGTDSGVTDTTVISLPQDIIVPAPSDQATVNEVEETGGAVMAYITYPNMADLLPNNFDQNSVKTHDLLVVNAPVVSLTIYDSEAPEGTGGQLKTPIGIDFDLLATDNRSYPQCVYWDFTLNEVGGGWSGDGCKVVGSSSGGSRVVCACSHLTHFTVVMDNSPTPVIVAEELLKAVSLYAFFSLAFILLLLSVLILTCVPGVTSNLNTIKVNLAMALLLADFVFLFGIDAVFYTMACKVVAILIHFFVLSGYGWLLVGGLHIYRMLTEIKEVNQGSMKFYYLTGWGVPLVIVALSVGLAQEGYGPQYSATFKQFCWFSLESDLKWSLAGPACAVILTNLMMFLMSVKEGCSRDSKAHSYKEDLRLTSLAGFLLLLFLSAGVAFSLLAVNFDQTMYFSLFAICVFIQGLLVFIMLCLCNKKVRFGLKRKYYYASGKKKEFDQKYGPYMPYVRSALAYSSKLDGMTPQRFNIGTSTGSSTTSKSNNSAVYRPDGYLRNTSTSTTSANNVVNEYVAPEYIQPYATYTPRNLATNLDHPDLGPDASLLHKSNLLGIQENEDSDTDSEASQRDEGDDISLASSHSSDDDEEDDLHNNWRDIPNKNKLNKLSKSSPPTGPMHSTPKVTVPGANLPISPGTGEDAASVKRAEVFSTPNASETDSRGSGGGGHSRKGILKIRKPPLTNGGIHLDSAHSSSDKGSGSQLGEVGQGSNSSLPGSKGNRDRIVDAGTGAVKIVDANGRADFSDDSDDSDNETSV